MVLAMVAPGGSKRSDEGATLTKGQAEARSRDKWMAGRVDGLRARGAGRLVGHRHSPAPESELPARPAGPQRWFAARGRPDGTNPGEDRYFVDAGSQAIFWNELRRVRRNGATNMTFGYAQPFSFKLGETPAKITAVRQGATEIMLSDGRLVRASLQINDISPSRQKPGSLDISYSVVTEIVKCPDVPVHAVHETLQ
jgi:hypothetical protein